MVFVFFMFLFVCKESTSLRHYAILVYAITCRKSKPWAQIPLLDQGRSIKPKLHTGVEVYDKKSEEETIQLHATNEKPIMHINIFNKNSL